VRVSTLVVVLAALLALPAARLSGLIGGPDAPTGASITAHSRAAASNAPAPITTATSEAPLPAAPTPTVAVPTAATPTVRFVPTVVWTVAKLPPNGVEVYADPTASQPSLQLTGQTEFGTVRVLPVIAQQGGWLEVRLPVRPNDAVGWIQASAVTLSAVSDQIFVSLASRQLEWFHGQTLALETSVAIGSPASPTPPGEYYITDVLPSSGAYGPWILALNGHSDTYTDFDGGDARLAIHGSDSPSTIGEAVSHGCVHVPNSIDSVLAGAIKPGTVVEIS
jgi:hypothetical protein